MENSRPYPDLPGTPSCLRSHTEPDPCEKMGELSFSHGLEVPKINIRLLKREIKSLIYELEREFRMRKLLTSELMDSETRVEKDLIMEFLDTTKTTIQELEARADRFRVALESLEAKAKNLAALLLPGDIKSLSEAAAAAAAKKMERKRKREKRAKSLP